METRGLVSLAGEKTLPGVKIQKKGIFQEDALSPLQFVFTIMPLNHLLRKCTGGYKLTNRRKKSIT